MEKFYNVQTFAKNYYNNQKLPKNICKLIIFTTHNKFNRDINCLLSFNDITKKQDKNEYIFNHNGKKHPFLVFSDCKLQKLDKKILTNPKRNKNDLIRSLKLACSLDLINPRIAIGNSILDTFSPLIMFSDNGIDKVIDYARNIIMNKDDYYELFNYKELNVVDKFDLYNIYYIMNNLNDYEHIYEYLIFTKEIFRELSKNDSFRFLCNKYDRNGINFHNYLLMGNDSDCLFFQEEDTHNNKYENIIKELDNFTENPKNKTKHISSSKEKHKLKERKFGFFTFDLLSDMICEQEIKEQLLSNSRYHECHQNAIIIARTLNEASTYVVGGKFKTNEIDKKNIVIDFNHNIIMNRDKYYKLFEIKVISKTLISEMEEIIQTVIYDAGFNMHPIEINYFGKEILKDLKKNKKVLLKK